MSQDRLTRHELSWLLAQEARGAAKTLRDEVVRVQRPSEPAPPPVATTLDALDDAIEMLSALNTGSRSGKKPRRGRIDLAALLYEVAPNARISIEPGAGTEVLGDEADLRRMFGVLLTQAGTGPSETEVHIRRQSDWVKISVELGPDVVATSELERRWLGRMATRHGGWFELESGTQAIFIQADGSGDQREVKELRAELLQAQELGEAYARELAGMLADGELRSEPPTHAVPRDGLVRFEVLKSAAAAFERILKGIAEGLRADAQLSTKSPEGLDSKHAASRRAMALTDAAAELAQIANCPVDEAIAGIDLAELARQVLSEAEARAARLGIELQTRLPTQLGVRAARSLLYLELRLLVSHAMAATPRGGVVRVSAISSELGVIVAVEDGGPSIPEASRTAVLRHSVDPTSFGRPSGIALLAAHAAAAALGAELDLREGASGSTEAWVTLPSVS